MQTSGKRPSRGNIASEVASTPSSVLDRHSAEPLKQALHPCIVFLSQEVGVATVGGVDGAGRWCGNGAGIEPL